MAEKDEVIVESVFSTIEYKGKDLVNAPFWKECYRTEDLTSTLLNNGKQWYEYFVKFNGLTPIQLTKTNKLKH